MDDIAARAKVAKGTLYLHFRDKEALYLGLIEDGMRRQFCDVFSKLADVLDPHAKLRRIIVTVVDFFDAYPYFLELIPTLDTRTPHRDFPPLHARKEEILALIGNVLVEIEVADATPVVDSGFAALCLLGIIHEVLRSRPRPWPSDIAERIEGQFLYGVRGRRP